MLTLQNVSKRYGDVATGVLAVEDLTFEIGPEEVVTVVGPSGCGKTTVLKLMAGLLSPSSGSITVNGREVSRPPEEIALVFQDYLNSLYPWMTVAQNIEFPLKRKVSDRSELRDRVATALDSVGLVGFEGKYPWQLSGGMQQRVAIARGLAYQPEILLMDEPFGALDAQTRADLEDLVLRVRDAFHITIVFVTHDIDESVYLADRVLVMGPRPTFIEADLPVILPEPRDQIETKGRPEFASVRSDVYRRIRRSSEAMRSGGVHTEGS